MPHNHLEQLLEPWGMEGHAWSQEPLNASMERYSHCGLVEGALSGGACASAQTSNPLTGAHRLQPEHETRQKI